MLAVLAAVLTGGLGAGAYSAVAFAASSACTPSSNTVCGFGTPDSTADSTSTVNYCGSGQSAVRVTINFGCIGKKCQPVNKSQSGCNAILDATFAIIRLLSDGVGLLVIGSIVYAGIQYTVSRGDPGKTKEAITRIRNTLISLLVYIFAYAILNFVLPSGFFQ